MNKSISAYPQFMKHPFWDHLRLHSASTTFSQLVRLEESERKHVVCAAVEGFYPISYASLQAFRRFSEIAPDAVSKEIAREIYLVEKGDKPLIKGSEMTGVLHCDQLKIMFESLVEAQLPIERPETFWVLHRADIPNASLTKTMAICDTIENTAPYVIHFYQDFLIQCQLAMGISSEYLKRTYLDEHNLTEGDSCEDQHIEMINRMKGQCAHLTNTPEYETEQRRFSLLVEAHFEQCRLKIEQLLKKTGRGAA